jgi:hypothetical protein
MAGAIRVPPKHRRINFQFCAAGVRLRGRLSTRDLGIDRLACRAMTLVDQCNNSSISSGRLKSQMAYYAVVTAYLTKFFQHSCFIGPSASTVALIDRSQILPLGLSRYTQSSISSPPSLPIMRLRRVRFSNGATNLYGG